eukprot:1160914-Pelagomonas_calceolata.AAC.4
MGRPLFCMLGSTTGMVLSIEEVLMGYCMCMSARNGRETQLNGAAPLLHAAGMSGTVMSMDCTAHKGDDLDISLRDPSSLGKSHFILLFMSPSHQKRNRMKLRER